MTNPHFDPTLVNTVRTLLAQPDWALHFPTFLALPYLGPIKDVWNAHKERSFLTVAHPRPLIEEASDDGFSSPSDEDSFSPNPLILPEDLVGEYNASRKPGGVDGLRSRRFAEMGLSDRAESINASPRLSVMNFKDCRIRGYLELVIAPVSYALTNVQGRSPDDEAALQVTLDQRARETGPWDASLLSILRRLTLCPRSGRLRWRVSHFRYAISVLRIRHCELEEYSTHTLAAFIKEDPNLVELDVSGNNCLVSDNTGSQ